MENLVILKNKIAGLLVGADKDRVNVLQVGSSVFVIVKNEYTGEVLANAEIIGRNVKIKVNKVENFVSALKEAIEGAL